MWWVFVLLNELWLLIQVYISSRELYKMVSSEVIPGNLIDLVFSHSFSTHPFSLSPNIFPSHLPQLILSLPPFSLYCLHGIWSCNWVSSYLILLSLFSLRLKFHFCARSNFRDIDIFYFILLSSDTLSCLIYLCSLNAWYICHWYSRSKIQETCLHYFWSTNDRFAPWESISALLELLIFLAVKL